MNSSQIALPMAILIGLTGIPAHAYELATHGRLTYEAFKRSVLNSDASNPDDAQFLKKVLGIENGANPFGTKYYDISSTGIVERERNLFEQDKDRMPRGTEPLSVEGWLLRGAIRFFRGRLEAVDAHYTDAGLSLRLKNAIDPEAKPYWLDETLAAAGTLVLAYQYKLNEQPVAGVLGLVPDTRSCT